MEARCHQLRWKTAPPAGRLRCGLLGTGHFFRYAYAPALNDRSSPITLAGLLARDGAKFPAAQKHLRHRVALYSEREALLTSGLEAAIILLPNHLHFEAAQAALERGLHVFCEKPLTPTVAEAAALQALAQKQGRVLMTDFNQRYFDRNRVLHRLIQEKAVGPVTAVHAYHNQDLRRAKSLAALDARLTGGGVLHNAGIHLLNLLLHWFGPPETAQAVFENRVLPASCGEDTAHCKLRFAHGVQATLDASLVNAVDTSYERVEIVGERGRITSDLKKGNVQLHAPGRPPLTIRCRPEIMSDSVLAALKHFADCVRTHSPPETNADDFIQTLKTVEALSLAAQRGAEVAWTEIDSLYAC